MESATPYRTLQPGDTVGSYRIERILGRGGFGVIYLAFDANLRYPVAVKEYIPGDIATRTENSHVHPISAEHGEMFRWGLDRFIKEARNLVKFRHPNIVRVTSLFQANNTAYMVMDFEEGEPLRSYMLRPGANSEEQLKALMLPVSEGLIEVHRQGFIHRDIKPSNILIRRDGSPVLIDFGSARHASKQLETKGLTALVSAGYAPLEQYNVESEEQQGPWSDIYALGGVLYYAISGQDPVDSTQRGSALFNGGKDPLVPATVVAQGRYSEPFLRAIDWALKVGIADRPQCVSDWVPALMSNTIPPDAAQTTREYIRSQHLALDSDIVDQSHRRQTQRSRRSRKRSSRWATILSALVVLAVGGWAVNNELQLVKRFLPGLTKEPSQGTSTKLTNRNADATPVASVGLTGSTVESEATQVQREQAAAKLAAEKAMAAEIERVAALEAARIEREERLAADAAAENERLKAEALLEAQRAEAEKERTAKEAEAVRLTALENRRSMNRAINEATRALESGDLARAAKDLELARSFKIFDKRIPALQTNLDRAYQDRAKPVTDAEFERAVKSFHALKRAIETKDVASMDELTVTSNQNALFAQLISRFASLDIEITGIRVRNTDRSVVGILRIDRMLRANGDLTMPSDTYRNREIKRRRINGRWTLIEW